MSKLEQTYGKELIKPYEGAGAAFEGIWERWHQWEWAPDNTCRVEDLRSNMSSRTLPEGLLFESIQLWSMFEPLKKALSTPDLEVGAYTSLESGWEGYSGGSLEVEYGGYPDKDYEEAQKFIADFESKLLAWCKSIDGGK